MAKRTGPINQNLKALIQELRKLSNQQNSKLWKRIALDLEKPTRQRRVVNISRINRHTKKNENIIVPGKVLGSGVLEHPVTVAAWQFSQQAKEKINKIGKAIPIQELMKQDIKGKGVRIIG